MPTTIIFDFFDVIRTDALKAWLSQREPEIKNQIATAWQNMDSGKITLDGFMKALSDITGQSPAELFEEMERGAALDHDVLELIRQLKPRYKIGLLSNAPSGFLRDLLREHDLEQYFDTIVISSEVGLIKPQPEIFTHMLELMNVTPQDALFIDDNPHNIAGGEAVGIKGITYTSIAQLKTELAKRGVEA